MSAIHELSAGQAHTLPLAALNVTLTGSIQGRPDLLAPTVMLRAVDQAGAESVTVRLTNVQVILTPEPRRLRLVASPAGGGTFPAGTSIGLTVMTEGATVAAQQILVAAVDAGALAQCEMAVLEFATDRAILTVAGEHAPDPAEAAPRNFISGSGYGTVASAPTAQPVGRPSDDAHPWIRAGRYALRDTAQLGGPDRVGAGTGARWGVALDGSASLRRPGVRTALEALLVLACGVFVEWTGSWATVAAVVGVERAAVDAARTDPDALVAAALDADEPASWCFLAPAAEQLAGSVGAGGSALIVADGLPADVGQLARVAQRHPDVRFHLLTFGTSPHGLASDTRTGEWWQDDLSGVEQLAELANVDVIAVRRREDGSPLLEGARAAELALRLTRVPEVV